MPAVLSDPMHARCSVRPHAWCLSGAALCQGVKVARLGGAQLSFECPQGCRKELRLGTYWARRSAKAVIYA